MKAPSNYDQFRSAFLVVGSDTGVGKTIFSGFLANYLESRGMSLHLFKPFCSGGMGDLDFLQAANAGGAQSKMNYWYNDDPISPAAWELRTGNKINFNQIVIKMKDAVLREVKDIVLIEGVGGLLAPISENCTVASLGEELGSNLIIVAPNKVGVINQVLLTLEAALNREISVASVILMEQEKSDVSVVDNAELIRRNMLNIPDFKGVFEFPWLGRDASNPNLISNNVKKADSVLEKIFDEVFVPSFITVLRT